MIYLLFCLVFHSHVGLTKTTCRMAGSDWGFIGMVDTVHVLYTWPKQISLCFCWHMALSLALQLWLQWRSTDSHYPWENLQLQTAGTWPTFEQQTSSYSALSIPTYVTLYGSLRKSVLLRGLTCIKKMSMYVCMQRVINLFICRGSCTRI